MALLAATGALTAHLASAAAGGVYSTRTAVTFMQAYESSLGVNGSVVDEDVIAFAGAVAAEVVPGREAVRYSAADAPYYGAGLREGILVGLLDQGNQWTPSYGAAVIVIQIVGPTLEAVRERQREALERIEHSAYLQQQPGAATDVSARVDPLSMRIEHIAPSRIAQGAALAAMSLAGGLAAGIGAVGADRVLAGRHTARRPHRRLPHRTDTEETE
ncbi:hypothetical protein GCM10010921_27000 [Microbacterium album]|uniref:Uncharacterized protein n=1 Tax=Microbacterium album TaxID=2053191 RepID=A0A917IH00_9MICO|nr:hypothetical protein GCM10010921_27000 [Microbacterium album]